MKWSWKIINIAGIDVFIHATFLLIIGWIGLSYWQQTGTVGGTLNGILFTLVLFGCVVLHEFGHALTARRYGIKTRNITVYPIGGIAQLERMPDKPIQEFWVALAGPAVNIVIALLLMFWLILTGGVGALGNINLSGGSFIERLLVVNVTLVLFNLIPAFPLDGGRILRSVLAMRLEYGRATQIAATIGQGMAFLFGLIGLFINPFLLFIAIVVWIGAGQESALEKMKSTLDGIPVRRAMLTDFQVLSSKDNISRGVNLILSGSQTDFPVVEGNAVVGILRRKDILEALSREGQEVPVVDTMHQDFQSVDANERLDLALLRMQSSGSLSMPVTQQGQLVGLLTSDNIGEFLMIHSALKKTHNRDRLLAHGT